MPYVSQNPATNEVTQTFPGWDSARLASALRRTAATQTEWRGTDFETRARLMTQAGEVLRSRRDEFAALMTQEMGKLTREAQAEVEKCALACDYFAVHGGPFLHDEFIDTDAGRSYVTYPPLGVILAVMPWNFPFWQVFRFAAPALMAGNGCVLKHASNVPQCALAIEAAFREAGFPEHLFTAALIDAVQVAEAIASPLVHAVTLTGSEATGRKVAATAGEHLKKCVLELGGSDPFVVLEDADLDLAVTQAVNSRFQNCGQSCIAAKRFILVPEIADAFIDRFKERVEALRLGDPADAATQLGPMARSDLRDDLHRQVTDSVNAGAVAVTGGRPLEQAGAWYAPTILDRVTPNARAYHEELFGPVAIVIRATDEDDAIRIANDTRFGLGASLWGRDAVHAERLAGQIDAGVTFVNGMVKSDPRLPFGGVKASGYGRELCYHGIREFVNAKTVWIREGAVVERRRGDRRRVTSDRHDPEGSAPAVE